MISREQVENTVLLNKQFYKNHQERFSKTRHNSWLGWKRVTELINQKIPLKEISILDVGCGNGRFYAHLTSHIDKPFTYLGLDTNDYLMVEALLKYEDTDFKSHDVILSPDKIENRYDVVVAFGLTHHIPGNDYRRKWFSAISELVNPGGLLIFSNWQLDKDSRSKKLVVAEDLEDNDFYYGWDDSEDKRYVHIYSEDEMSEITDLLKQKSLDLIETFVNDGRTGKLNEYYVLKRSS